MSGHGGHDDAALSLLRRCPNTCTTGHHAVFVTSASSTVCVFPFATKYACTQEGGDDRPGVGVAPTSCPKCLPKQVLAAGTHSAIWLTCKTDRCLQEPAGRKRGCSHMPKNAPKECGQRDLIKVAHIHMGRERAPAHRAAHAHCACARDLDQAQPPAKGTACITQSCYPGQATFPGPTSPVGLLSERTTSCTPLGFSLKPSKNWIMSSWLASKGRLLILTTLSYRPGPCPLPCNQASACAAPWRLGRW